MAKRRNPKDIKAVLSEIDGASPRAAILVAGAIIEDALEEMIMAHLRWTDQKSEREKLFSVHLLDSFSSKIWMAYFMTLVGRSTRKDLDAIRDIRNIAAHDPNAVTFKSEAIKDRIQNILIAKRMGAPLTDDTEKAFKRIVGALVMLMTGRAAYGSAIRAGIEVPTKNLDDLIHLDE
jgi:hypothetical protein